MMDTSRQTVPMYLHPAHIDQDIADLKRLIHYVELRGYDAARRARAIGNSAKVATADMLLRKLRGALNDAMRLRQTAMRSGPQWAV